MATAVLLWACLAWAGDGGTAAPAKPDKAPEAKAAPDAGTRSTGFAATPLFLVTETPEALEKLEQVAPKDRAANKTIVTKMQIGKRYYLGVFVDGYTLPRSRRVDLAADLTLTDPAGDVRVERASAATSQMIDPKNPTAFLRPGLPMTWALTDLEGEYKVRIKLYDQVRGEFSESTGRFTVVR